jgi:AcrR family transcriptional regulator
MHSCMSNAMVGAVATRRTRAEKQAETRARLLDAAAEVFARRGLVAASVEEITAEAGFSRGAFYSNFASKEELFAELLRERVHRLYARMAEHRARAGAAPSGRATGEALARLHDDPEDRRLFRLWLELLAHAGRSDELGAVAREFWRRNRELTAGVVRREHAAAGTEPPAPPERLATLLIALDMGLALQHAVDPEEVPLDVYGELYALVFDRR